MPFRGWESVTVPGAVSSWITLSEKFGFLPFDNLFAPAIKYANEGFSVSPIISRLWKIGADELKNEVGFAENFMRNNRAPFRRVFINKDLGRSLTLMPKQKQKPFTKENWEKQ